MKFKRWGSLAPQKHTLDETKFHCAPVKNGIYAFPVEYADTDYIFGYACIRNGRYRYVKDKDGKKVMMTQKELDGVKTKMTESYHSIVASPDFLRGMDYDSLFLKTEYIYDLDKPEKEDDDVMGGDEGIITIDPDKRYPLMTKINKPLHPSQKLLNENADGSCVFQIEVVINLEMFSVFMSYGNGVRILSQEKLQITSRTSSLTQ